MSLYPKSKPHDPVNCESCNHQFPQDPPFEVKCPTCGAELGTYCKRPSDHTGMFVPFHKERDIEALAKGFYDHIGNDKCGPNSDTEKAKLIINEFQN